VLEPLAVMTTGLLLSLGAFWLEPPLRWGALGVGAVVLLAGLGWLIGVVRHMSRTADAWRRR